MTFSSLLVRRDAFMEVGGFDAKCHAGEDWDLLLRLAERFHFSVVPDPVTRYRWSGNSFSKRHAFFLKYKVDCAQQCSELGQGQAHAIR